MACQNMTDALLEDVIEITMMNDLIEKGEIMPLSDILEADCGWDGVKATIKEIAKEFEQKYPYETSWEDTDLDYIEEVETFSKKKLIERYKMED